MNTDELNGNSLHGHFSFHLHPPKPKVWQESLKELHGIREGGCVEQLGGGEERFI